MQAELDVLQADDEASSCYSGQTDEELAGRLAMVGLGNDKDDNIDGSRRLAQPQQTGGQSERSVAPSAFLCHREWKGAVLAYTVGSRGRCSPGITEHP